MKDDYSPSPAPRRNPRDRYREQVQEVQEGRNARAAEARPRGRSVEILPSPEVLEGYEAVVPGAAQTIMAMLAEEQKHRHQWEDQSLKVHALGSVLGQILGFAIIVSVLAAATTLGLSGQQELSAFLGIFGLTAMIWAYIRTEGKRQMYRPLREQYYENKGQERQTSKAQQRDAAPE